MHEIPPFELHAPESGRQPDELAVPGQQYMYLGFEFMLQEVSQVICVQPTPGISVQLRDGLLAGQEQLIVSATQQLPTHFTGFVF